MKTTPTVGGQVIFPWRGRPSAEGRVRVLAFLALLTIVFLVAMISGPSLRWSRTAGKSFSRDRARQRLRLSVVGDPPHHLNRWWGGQVPRPEARSLYAMDILKSSNLQQTMFKRLSIEHYRSITSADIDLDKIAVFVGKNSSGKSNVIDALHFLQEAFRNGLDFAVSQRFGIKSVRQWSPTRPYRIRIAVELENRRGHGYFSIKLDSFADSFVIFEEVGYWQYQDDYPTRHHGGAWARFDRGKNGIVRFTTNTQQLHAMLRGTKFEYDQAELAINSLSRLPFGEVRGFRELWNEIQNFEAYAIYANTIRSPQKPSNSEQLSRHGENISTIIKKLLAKRRSTRGFEELNSLMQLVIPNLERIEVETVGGLLAPKFIMMSDGKKRHSFNVSQISDGSLRLLGLLGALYQTRPPSAIALEEPEQNINPGYLTIIAEAVKDVARTHQIFITTHSPHLVDHFDVSSIHAVELSHTGTQVGKIAPSQVEAVKRKLFTVGELMTTEGLIAS